jgi:RNA polymerase sigma factor (sigma-70 family)
MIAATNASTTDPLWEALQKGDQNALAQLYERHSTSLLHYGVTLTGDKELVKDCVQELFITLWNQRSRLSPAQSVHLYLLVSLKRLILRQLKKNRAAFEAPVAGSEQEQPAEYLIVDKEERQKQQKVLLAEINRLPKRQIEAIFLRFYEELSYEDIASVMNLNYQGARNIVYKAVKTLRKHLHSRTFAIFHYFFF